MEIGEIVYSPTEDRFFSITNAGPDWIFGEWNDAEEVVGRKLLKKDFRRTTWAEWIGKNRSKYLNRQ